MIRLRCELLSNFFVCRRYLTTPRKWKARRSSTTSAPLSNLRQLRSSSALRGAARCETVVKSAQHCCVRRRAVQYLVRSICVCILGSPQAIRGRRLCLLYFVPIAPCHGSVRCLVLSIYLVLWIRICGATPSYCGTT